LIKRFSYIFKKLICFLRENGIIITILKINDYLSFKISGLKIKRIKPLSLENDFIKLKAELKGMSLTFQDNPEAGAIGFYAAVKNLEAWHDSAEADFSFQKKADSLIVKPHLWNIPLDWDWTVTLKDRGLIWRGALEVENCILTEGIKAGFVINSVYQEIVLSKDYRTLMAKSPLSNIPNLNLKLIDACYCFEVKAESLNCDENENKIIEIAIKDELKFKSGKYQLFNLELLMY
jgi:hypothetical protein